MSDPITIVEIDRDICSLVYGVGLCTATGTPCYNTWETCQVKPVFAVTTQVMRFVKPRADIPMSLNAIPSVRSTTTSPTELNVGDVDAASGPLGKRAQATVTFEDHPYSDALTDPYVATRSLNPFQNGTFWTKLKARWPIAKGRALRIRDGYLGQDPEDMVSREYLIDAIDGPNSSGIVTVRAVDPLRLLDDKTSQAPKQSSGSLAADITNSQTTITVQNSPIETKNLLLQPERLWDATFWSIGSTLGNFYAATESTAILNFRGQPGGVARFVAQPSTAVLFLRKILSITAGAKSASIWVYVPSQSGVTNWSIQVDAADVEVSGLFTSTVFNKWVRAIVPTLTIAATRSFFDFNILANGLQPTSGFTFYASGAQLEAGSNHTEYTPGSEYFPNGTLRIESELLTYTAYSISGGVITFTGITRATDGSAAKEHKAESRVQSCVRYTNQNAWEVAKNLIDVYAPSAAGYIDATQWAAEAAQWLDGFIVSGVISEPTGLNTLLAELCRDAQFFIWWDERLQKILLRAVRPPTETPVQFNEDANILAGSQSIKTAPNERVSQLWYYYEPADLSKKVDAEDNYRKVRIRIDAESESAREYDESAVKKIYSRWVRTDAIVIAITTRIIARYRDDPLYLTISVDAKDRNTWTADVVDVSSRLQTNTEGLPLTRRYQVISAQEVQPGAVIKYVLQTYDFTAKYAYWMASDAPIFSLATDEEKALGAWWSDDDGLISGESGYEWQ